jgi:hypothetical protein
MGRSEVILVLALAIGAAGIYACGPGEAQLLRADGLLKACVEGG